MGTGATSRWTPNGARKELQELGPSLVVVAIKYNDHNEGLNHSDLLDEVFSHCTGRDSVPFRSIPTHPMYGIGDISFYGNDQGWMTLRVGVPIAIPICHP